MLCLWFFRRIGSSEKGREINMPLKKEKQNCEIQIKDWVACRKKFLKDCGRYGEKRTAKEIAAETQANKLGKWIFDSLVENFDTLACDFVLESLTMLGYAPSLLYDDNGCWAVVGDGIQPVVAGNDRLDGNMTFFCEKRQWFKTIRSALGYYLKDIKR
jgi:hypothetical protein